MQDASELIAELLKRLDQDPGREGLRETPGRVEAFLHDFMNPEPIDLKVFQNEGYDEMVVQSGIPFFSICEHHLLPFFGHGTIAYLPDKHIVGLSKLSRILDNFSRRLQNQERLTTQVTDYLSETVQPKGVGVILEARHLCMEMRGVRQPGTITTTSGLRGRFKSDPRTRAEFMRLARTGNG